MAITVEVRDENERERAGKSRNHFRFHFLLRKTGAGAETGYNGYGNGREPKNLPEYIMI